MSQDAHDSGEDFRAEVAAFLEDHWSNGRGREDVAAFRAKAIARGYLYRYVPVEYGGSGQPPDARKAQIIREEFDRVRAPTALAGGAVRQLLPTLLAVAEDWQKQLFIPRTLAGEITWCQGYSEPGAGSDLASLRTTAVLDGDEWVINGQKVWTSDARTATHMYCLARTEPDQPKHAGISYLLLDMRQPGVTVRPLKQITGDATFNEVFFDNARTPASWIVGKRGEGWLVSRTTLEFERAVVGGTDGTQTLFEKLIKLAMTTQVEGRRAIDDPLIRDEICRIQMMIAAQRADAAEQARRALKGDAKPPAGGAFAKLYGSTITERMALAAQKIMGEAAIGAPRENAPGPSRWVSQFMNSIAAQIGGGTSNMQRNVIAERHLGLPRDR
jgi:alkylation response protein AidB-like acyl-CoA dehydrogenase